MSSLLSTRLFSHLSVLGAVATFSIAVTSASPTCAQSRLLAILVADTISQDIREDMEWNLGSLQFVLESNLPPNRLEIVTLKDNMYSQQAIQNAISRLDVRSDDAILFFYSGHGYYQPGVGSFLVPPSDEGARLYLKNIRTWLQHKNARFTVSILDSCSVIPGGINTAPAPNELVRPATVTPFFQELFFNSRGTFHINSSSPGEYAVCRTMLPDGGIMKGSLFCNVFCERLSDGDSAQNWKRVYELTKQSVDQSFRQFYQYGVISLGNGRSIRQETQTVWAFENERQLR